MILLGTEKGLQRGRQIRRNWGKLLSDQTQKSGAKVHAENFDAYLHSGKVEAMNSFHTHFDIELNYVFSGSMKYFMGRSEVELPRERLVAFWGGTPHRLVEASKDTEAAVFTITLPTFIRWKPSKAILELLIDGGILVENQVVTPRDKVMRWVEEYRSPNRFLREATMLELQAALWRAQPAVINKKVTGESAVDVESVLQMCKYISSDITKPHSSAEIAAHVGLHPNYAMRVFKKITKMTIQEYVVAQRVAAAQRLLLTSEELVENIGKLAGFQSTSQYYAVFRKQTGFSPLQYRKRYLVQ